MEKAGIAIGIDRVDGGFEYLNDQFIEIFGYSPLELQSLSHQELVHLDDYAMVSEIHKERVAGREVPSRYEFRAVRRDGSTIWLEVEAVPVERDLQQAQKMEAIGRLAGGVAHEFNNLLQAMLSTAEARLAMDADDASSDLLQEFESLIQRGRSQTRQLLLFSRREEPQPEPLELNRVLRENLAMLERLIADNVRLELQLDHRDSCDLRRHGEMTVLRCVVSSKLEGKTSSSASGLCKLRGFCCPLFGWVHVEV